MGTPSSSELLRATSHARARPGRVPCREEWSSMHKEGKSTPHRENQGSPGAWCKLCFYPKRPIPMDP